MTEENNLQKLKKDYPEFFKEGPSRLIELANSEKTVSQIAEICLKNNIENEETVESVAHHIASVLLGSLPPKILPKALVTNVKIDPKAAEKISGEANRLIFSRVKNDLAKLYPPAKTKTMPEKESAKKPPRKDTYRESIE